MAADPRQAPPAPESNEAAIAQAIQSVTASTQALVKDQVELAKLEMQAKASVFGKGAAVGAAAGAFVVGALSLILQGAAWLAWYLIFPSDQFLTGTKIFKSLGPDKDQLYSEQFQQVIGF